MKSKDVKRLSLLILLLNLSFYCTAQSIDKNKIYGVWESKGENHTTVSTYKSSGELVEVVRIEGLNDIIAYFDFKVVEDIIVQTSRAYGTKAHRTILALTNEVMVTENYLNGEKIISTYTKKK